MAAGCSFKICMHIHIHAATASFRSGTLREAAFPFCCRRQLFFLAAGGNFSLVLQEAAFLLCCREAAFLLCCRRQLFSCAAGGSFSFLLQEGSFSFFFLQEAAFLLCCRRQLSLSRCRRQLSLSRCRKQLFFPFGAVGCCNVSCSFLCAVCVTGLAPCGVFFFLPCAVLRREVEPVKA